MLSLGATEHLSVVGFDAWTPARGSLVIHVPTARQELQLCAPGARCFAQQSCAVFYLTPYCQHRSTPQQGSIPRDPQASERCNDMSVASELGARSFETSPLRQTFFITRKVGRICCGLARAVGVAAPVGPKLCAANSPGRPWPP